jgi:hypothetical protein
MGWVGSGGKVPRGSPDPFLLSPRPDMPSSGYFCFDSIQSPGRVCVGGGQGEEGAPATLWSHSKFACLGGKGLVSCPALSRCSAPPSHPLHSSPTHPFTVRLHAAHHPGQYLHLHPGAHPGHQH